MKCQYINQSAVRAKALSVAARKWPDGRMSRVGSSFLERINGAVLRAIESEVNQHPTLGKTLK